MRFLLGPSGGTASPMGSCLHYISRDHTNQYFFVPGMWRTMVGLTNMSIIPAEKVDSSYWSKYGGSPFVPSCKNTNVFNIDGQDLSSKVRDFCKDYDAIIAVGGGGTTFQASELYEAYGIPSIVVLATMDNDIIPFDNVLGFETAIHHLSSSIHAVCDDAYTMQRPMIIYTMGYDCGRVAVNATKLARKSIHGAQVDMLHIPETGVSVEQLAEKVQQSYKGGPFVIVASEGVCKSTSGEAGIHKKFSTGEYTKTLSELSGIDFKGISADYVQRSGVPAATDLRLARKFAEQVHDLIAFKQFNQVIGSINGNICHMPLDEVATSIRGQNSVSPWYGTPLTSLEAVKDILVK